MFIVPFDAELECKQNEVVYDSNSTNEYFRVKRECSFYPFDAELEYKQNVVVYDSISTNVYFRVKRGCSLSRLMLSWSVNKM